MVYSAFSFLANSSLACLSHTAARLFSSTTETIHAHFQNFHCSPKSPANNNSIPKMYPKTLLTLLPLLGQFSLAAPAADGTTTATSPFPTRPAPRRCGGFTPEPNPCPPGLVCAPTQPPGTFDLPGTCILQSCGGKSPTINPCPVGQVCVYNATSPITDLPGRCMAAVLTCGRRQDRGCTSGWECLKEPKIDFNYREDWTEEKGKGICIPAGSLVVKEP